MTTRLRQQGATLIVALIMLLLLALLGLGAFHTSINDLKTSGNMQARNEALNAAQETIETVISTRQFVSDPANALTTPCGAANTLCTDLDGDGVAEYRTRLNPMPSCVTKKVIKVLDLNVASSEDLGCAVGQSQQFGIVGLDASAGDSLCANTVWQVTAEATSVRSDAKVTVSQGISLRIATDEVTGACI